jgi:TonB-dependent starch-binding outer membrane protein SusC
MISFNNACMRALVLFFLIIFSQLFNKGYSQSVSISEKNISLQKVFNTIEKQTGYLFWYEYSLIENALAITIKVKNVSLAEALDRCLNGLPLTYTIKGKIIIISPVKNRSQVNSTTNDSTIFTSQTLDDIMVVGYGSLAKKNITGVISSISLESIENQPLTSVDQAIAGKAAGVQVSQFSASPGGGAVIRVRGTGSISASNEPLYVIDGFPVEGVYNRDMNPLATIDVNDIESIQILKDASAAAIYGSRGSNGVVIINSKRATADKPIVHFSSYYGSQRIANKTDMLNATEYALYNTEARNNAWSDLGGHPSDPNDVRPDALKIPPMFSDPISLGKGTDWQDAVLRTAPIQHYHISVANGKEGTRYMLSAGYFKQEGIIINTSFERSSVKFNIDSKLFDQIKLGFTISPTYSKNNVRPVQDQVFDNSILGSALAMPPTLPVYNADGSYTSILNTSPYNIGILNNPVAVANKVKENTTVFRTLAGIFAEWDIIKNLQWRSSFGADYYEDRYSYYRPSDLGVGLTAPPVIAEGKASTQRSFVWLNENTLTWNKSINNQHFINAVAGLTSQKAISERAALGAVYYPNDLVTTLNAGYVNFGTTDISEWSLSSYLARINYSYQSKYMVTATIRRDGSSRFGSKNRWGTFPSASIGWNIAKENFMQPLQAVSNFKIKASYGYAGNNNIGNYSYAGLLGSSDYVFGTGFGNIARGLGPYTMANQYLGWEVMKQTDIGAEIGLFNNRINIIVDYFNKTTSSLLLNVPVPGSIGFTTALENIGKVNNKGWECTLMTDNIKGAFTWKTSANISFIKNKVLELGRNGGSIVSTTQSFNGQSHITMIGQPVSSFYGYKVIGVYRDQADIDKNPVVEGPGGSRPGDLKFKDINNDGVITAADMTIIGNNYPDFTYGLTNEFSYLNISLSILIDGVQGAELFNGARKNISLATGSYSRRDVLNRWQSPEQPGDGKTPRANTVPTGGNASFISSLLVEDALFLRIRNINVAYSFSKKMLGNSRLNNATVFLSAQNAFTFTKYKGYNPEQSLSGADALRLGGDFNGYPLAKVFSVGISITIE